MRILILSGAVLIALGIAATGAAQRGGPVTQFQLPTSTGPFVPKGPHPLTKPRVDCGNGVYAEGVRVTIGGKKGWRFPCPD